MIAMDQEQIAAILRDITPARRSAWQRFTRWAYTRLLLATRADAVANALLNDPCLFNARHYAALGQHEQYAVMAIHFNTQTDRRAELTGDDVRRLLTAKGSSYATQ